MQFMDTTSSEVASELNPTPKANRNIKHLQNSKATSEGVVHVLQQTLHSKKNIENVTIFFHLSQQPSAGIELTTSYVTQVVKCNA